MRTTTSVLGLGRLFARSHASQAGQAVRTFFGSRGDSAAGAARVERGAKSVKIVRRVRVTRRRMIAVLLDGSSKLEGQGIDSEG